MDHYEVRGYGLFRGTGAEARLVASFSRKEDGEAFMATWFALQARIAHLERVIAAETGKAA